MSSHTHRLSRATALVALPLVVLAQLASATTARAQGSPASPPDARIERDGARTLLSPASYDRIAALGAAAISPDGRWVAYDERRGSGGGELTYRRLGTEEEQTIPQGSAPVFTGNSRWLLYTVVADSTPSWARSSGGRGQGGGTGSAPGAGGAAGAEPRRNGVGVVDLRTGATLTLPDVQSYSVSDDGGYVALRGYAQPVPRERGANLVVRDLGAGTSLSFGNVAEYAWSDDAPLLAMLTDVGAQTGNGVQLLDAATGALTSLDAGEQGYSGLGWRPHARDLAVLRARVDSAFTDTTYVAIAWRGLGSARVSRRVHDFASDSGVPDGLGVAAYQAPQWSDDGSVVFLGLAPRQPRGERGARPAPGKGPAGVEVWHWKDTRLYHQQNRQAQQDRQRTILASWLVDRNVVVPLARELDERVQLAGNGAVALVSDDSPYLGDALSGRSYRDVYTVDVRTGAREKVLTRSAFGAATSPGGRYLVYSEGGDWWTLDRTSGARANLTGRLGTSFVNMEDDHPVPERRPYGVAGWTRGDGAVILQDRFDLWRVAPDGRAPVRLTRGREDSTVYRLLDPTTSGRGFGRAIEPLDPRAPAWLSATGEYSRRSGFARLDLGRATAERQLWLDMGTSRLLKARDADVFTYVAESYERSPQLYVARGGVRDGEQLSRLNGFLADHAWGRQELLDYVTPSGDTLQMMLTYPVNYDPARKYPMVVYYYEKLSQGYQQFIAPTERAMYNTTIFSQNGYFVLRPDIRFRPRDPGISGLECVTAAVQTALATGMMDPARVGNMGHSWGGYQSAFYAVHAPHLFAASIAGAPLTNLVSMYGYTSYNTGMPETGHFETGQERMEVSLWEDRDAYIRNSTVFAVDSLRIPLLLEEGDADGNVNYWQSMELYNFGRRLGKNVVFLLYNGENHNLVRAENQRDYQQRQLEWFGHYLKGEPAPAWITEGESYLTRQKLLRDAAGAGRESPTASPNSAPARVP